jgi:hypothetical protein
MLSSLTFEDFAEECKRVVDLMEGTQRNILELALLAEKYAASFGSLEKDLAREVEKRGWMEQEIKDMRRQLQNIGRAINFRAAQDSAKASAAEKVADEK